MNPSITVKLEELMDEKERCYHSKTLIGTLEPTSWNISRALIKTAHFIEIEIENLCYKIEFSLQLEHLLKKKHIKSNELEHLLNQKSSSK